MYDVDIATFGVVNISDIGDSDIGDGSVSLICNEKRFDTHDMVSMNDNLSASLSTDRGLID